MYTYVCIYIYIHIYQISNNNLINNTISYNITDDVFVVYPKDACADGGVGCGAHLPEGAHAVSC